MPKGMYGKRGKANSTGMPFSGASSKSFPVSMGMPPQALKNRQGTPNSMYKDDKMRKKGIMKQLFSL